MSDLSETAPFWMVYGLGRGAPRAQHDSEAKAIREAERLARVEPGATFVVLESIHAIRKVDVERFDLRTAPSQGRTRAPGADDIPF